MEVCNMEHDGAVACKESQQLGLYTQDLYKIKQPESQLGLGRGSWSSSFRQGDIGNWWLSSEEEEE